MPLWGLDRIGDNTTVFVHEGAKAAKACSDMVRMETAQDRKALAEHPWGQELAGAAHVGWIGGALSPMRTDWSVLTRNGVNKAYIVTDNDAPGRNALGPIAQQLRMICYNIQFTMDWPVSFDLADPFPDKFFRSIDERRVYIGPSFRSCRMPGTWMTDVVMVPGDGPRSQPKRVVTVREHAKDMWLYVEEVDMFVCREMPSMVFNDTVFNRKMASLSHTNNYAAIVTGTYHGTYRRMTYRPDIDYVITMDEDKPSVNIYEGPHIKSVEGDITPFMEYMAYLVPDYEEREWLLRWFYTIVAFPHIRMLFGILLVSEAQGIGKTTFASDILAPLLGRHNCSWPSEKDIVDSQFNEWLAEKRLVIASEIYSGHSWKCYHTLKAAITDEFARVNKKYQQPYTVRNWAHFIAMSNSTHALKMEDEDRRWFYPTITENKWSKQRFNEFHEWLLLGGLSIIKWWCSQQTDPIRKGDYPPMTARKKEMIRESYSPEQKEAIVIAGLLKNEGSECALAMMDINSTISNIVRGVIRSTDHELRKAMKKEGIYIHPTRIMFGDRPQHILYNDALALLIEDEKRIEDAMAFLTANGKKASREIAQNKIIRDHIRSVASLRPEEVI